MNKDINFLLRDEFEIDDEDYKERKKIYTEFCQMPIDFFSKLRHFQPQVGCLNCCSFCSKSSSPTIEYWFERRIRNVVSALKYSSKKYRNNEPLIVWDRKTHRNEVIFSYSDNDVGNYLYLDKFIKLAYEELGVRTRISTVGYSRYNEKLNKVHRYLANHPEYLGGVRLSFTPYAIGWCSNNKKFSKEEYTKDISNFLKIYYPYYNKVGSGCRKMCVELRYKPFVRTKKVSIGKINNHTYIYSNRYLYYSKNENVVFNISNIIDPLDHSIKLSEKPIAFYFLYLNEDIENIESYIKDGLNITSAKIVDIYMMKNEDGIYYSIDPSIKEDGNYGINIYPTTAKRLISGYVITERFFVNSLIKYKREFGLGKSEKFENATWDDVENALELLNTLADTYAKERNYDKANYISSNIISMVVPYAVALKNAGYPASCFFDPKFTIDTGIICNMGRAITEFKGLTSKVNNPMTPTHERNYGKTNSTMIVENVAWKLNCGYEDTIVIEKLNLCNTATEQGQVIFKKDIKLNQHNGLLTPEDLSNNYIIPGQRRFDK